MGIEGGMNFRHDRGGQTAIADADHRFALLCQLAQKFQLAGVQGHGFFS